MTTLREAAQRLLDLHDRDYTARTCDDWLAACREAREGLRAALAQPEQEPVAVQPQGRTGLTWNGVIQGLHNVLNDESEDHLSAAWHRARLLDAIDLMAANPPTPPQQPAPEPIIETGIVEDKV